MSVARLVYSQARIIGNQADDPGFFVPKYFGLSINFIFCQTGKDFFSEKKLVG